jgi:hypothetical protein
MTDVSDSLHFSDAHTLVAQQLGSARQQVLCALAGPCGRPLFELLLGCCRKGVALTLVVSGAPQDQAPGIAWERLGALGATLHRLRAGAPRLHTSVCVIDGTAVLSGDLARLQLLPDAQSAGLLLQSSASLADDCARGLSQFAVEHAQAQDAAPGGLPEGTAKPVPPTAAAPATALATFDDPQQWAPLWQTALLQAHALALQADLADMHRTINAFDQAQDAAIGPLLRDCLDAKRQHLQALHAQTGSDEARAQADDAQAQFERYTQDQDAKPAAAPALDAAAQAQMKQLYRKLAMRLHPDRVEEDDKAEAQALFQRLQVSFEHNDFAALLALEQQVLLAPQAVPGASTGKGTGTLRSAGLRSPAQQAAALKDRLAQHQRERSGILRSATWQTLSTQSNWTLWFSQQASYLQAEMQRYAQALGASSAPPAQQDPEGADTTAPAAAPADAPTAVPTATPSDTDAQGGAAAAP